MTPKQRLASGRNSGRRDDVRATQRENVFDADGRIAIEEADQRLKKAVDIAFVQCEQQFFLTGEVQIDGTFGEPASCATSAMFAMSAGERKSTRSAASIIA